MAMKRKCTCVSLEAKLEIINRLKKGESQSSLASEYRIGKSTVGDFKRNEEKIRRICESLNVSTKKHKVMSIICTNMFNFIVQSMLHISSHFSYLNTAWSHCVRISEGPLYIYL